MNLLSGFWRVIKSNIVMYRARQGRFATVGKSGICGKVTRRASAGRVSNRNTARGSEIRLPAEGSDRAGPDVRAHLGETRTLIA